MREDVANRCVGCLLIDDLLSGENVLSGLFSSVELSRGRVRLFDCPEGANLHEQLQRAHHAARKGRSGVAIAANGRGCDAALALAEQLPVERLALIAPEARRFSDSRRSGASPRLSRQANRLRAFARRNLALCVCDVLIVETAGARGGQALREGGLCANSRVTQLSLMGERDKNLYNNGEFNLKTLILGFLQRGELPKSLAENAEMCIIYE